MRLIRTVGVAGLLTLASIASASEAPEVGEPRAILELAGLQNCRYLAAEAPGGPALVCGRYNEPAFAWEILRVPPGDDESSAHPEVIGWGRQPDVRGSKLTWVGTEPGREGIWLDDLADDTPPVRLTATLDMLQPSIAADGETVACTRHAAKRDGLYLLRPGQGDAERLASQDERQPVWGPVGIQMLAIKTDQVWLLQAPRWQELVSERLTDAGMLHFDPAWGPNGEWITYAAGWSAESARVALMHLPSRRIWWPEIGVRGVRSPVISPDGTQLAFVGGDDDTTALYLCDLRLP